MKTNTWSIWTRWGLALLSLAAIQSWRGMTDEALYGAAPESLDYPSAPAAAKSTKTASTKKSAKTALPADDSDSIENRKAVSVRGAEVTAARDLLASTLESEKSSEKKPKKKSRR